MLVKNKYINSLIIAILFILIVTLPVLAELKVHFIDVGQGDAILIQTEDTNVLIDGGDRWLSVERTLLDYLGDHNVDSLDGMISTHPHADHIGSLTAVINNFHTKQVYDSGIVHTSKTYLNYLEIIDKKNIPFNIPARGDTIVINEIVFEVLHPTPQTKNSNLNNSSIVLRMEYGHVSFLFTGDLEAPGELDILKSGQDIQSTILKVAHHGSKSSTHKDFLDAVSPEVAVILVGEGNRYGHPNPEVIDKLNGIDILRSDINGNIVITTNGDNYIIEVEKCKYNIL